MPPKDGLTPLRKGKPVAVSTPMTSRLPAAAASTPAPHRNQAAEAPVTPNESEIFTSAHNLSDSFRAVREFFEGDNAELKYKYYLDELDRINNLVAIETNPHLQKLYKTFLAKKITEFTRGRVEEQKDDGEILSQSYSATKTLDYDAAYTKYRSTVVEPSRGEEKYTNVINITSLIAEFERIKSKFTPISKEIERISEFTQRMSYEEKKSLQEYSTIIISKDGGIRDSGFVMFEQLATSYILESDLKSLVDKYVGYQADTSVSSFAILDPKRKFSEEEFQKFSAIEVFKSITNTYIHQIQEVRESLLKQLKDKVGDLSIEPLVSFNSIIETFIKFHPTIQRNIDYLGKLRGNEEAHGSWNKMIAKITPHLQQGSIVVDYKERKDSQALVEIDRLKEGFKELEKELKTVLDDQIKVMESELRRLKGKFDLCDKPKESEKCSLTFDLLLGTKSSEGAIAKERKNKYKSVTRKEELLKNLGFLKLEMNYFILLDEFNKLKSAAKSADPKKSSKGQGNDDSQLQLINQLKDQLREAQESSQEYADLKDAIIEYYNRTRSRIREMTGTASSQDKEDKDYLTLFYTESQKYFLEITEESRESLINRLEILEKFENRQYIFLLTQSLFEVMMKSQNLLETQIYSMLPMEERFSWNELFAAKQSFYEKLVEVRGQLLQWKTKIDYSELIKYRDQIFDLQAKIGIKVSEKSVIFTKTEVVLRHESSAKFFYYLIKDEIANLEGEVRYIVGDFSKYVDGEYEGITGKIAEQIKAIDAIYDDKRTPQQQQLLQAYSLGQDEAKYGGTNYKVRAVIAYLKLRAEELQAALEGQKRGFDGAQAGLGDLLREISALKNQVADKAYAVITNNFTESAAPSLFRQILELKDDSSQKDPTAKAQDDLKKILALTNLAQQANDLRILELLGQRISEESGLANQALELVLSENGGGGRQLPAAAAGQNIAVDLSRAKNEFHTQLNQCKELLKQGKNVNGMLQGLHNSFAALNQVRQRAGIEEINENPEITGGKNPHEIYEKFALAEIKNIEAEISFATGKLRELQEQDRGYSEKMLDAFGAALGKQQEVLNGLKGEDAGKILRKNQAAQEALEAARSWRDPQENAAAVRGGYIAAAEGLVGLLQRRNKELADSVGESQEALVATIGGKEQEIAALQARLEALKNHAAEQDQALRGVLAQNAVGNQYQLPNQSDSRADPLPNQSGSRADPQDQDAHSQIQDMSGAGQNLARMLAGLQGEKEDLERRMEALQGEKDRLEKELDNLKAQLSYDRQKEAGRIQDLEAEARRLTSEFLQKESDKALLSEQIRDLQDQLSGKDAQIAALQEENNQLQDQKHDLERQLHELQAQISQEQQINADLQRQNSDLQQTIAELQDQVQAKEQEIVALRAELAAAQPQDRDEILRKLKGVLKDSLQDARRLLGAAQGVQDRDEIMGQINDLIGLASDRVKREIADERIGEACDVYNRAAACVISFYRDLIQIKDKKILALEGQNSLLQFDKEKNEEELGQLLDKIKKLESQINDSAGKEQSSEYEIKKLNERLTRIVKESDGKSKEVESLAAENAELKAQRTQLNTNLERLGKTIADKDAELKKQKQDAAEDVRQKDQENKQLQEELEKLKGQLEQFRAAQPAQTAQSTTPPNASGAVTLNITNTNTVTGSQESEAKLAAANARLESEKTALQRENDELKKKIAVLEAANKSAAESKSESEEVSVSNRTQATQTEKAETKAQAQQTQNDSATQTTEVDQTVSRKRELPQTPTQQDANEEAETIPQDPPSQKPESKPAEATAQNISQQPQQQYTFRTGKAEDSAEFIRKARAARPLRRTTDVIFGQQEKYSAPAAADAARATDGQHDAGNINLVAKAFQSACIKILKSINDTGKINIDKLWDKSSGLAENEKHIFILMMKYIDTDGELVSKLKKPITKDNQEYFKEEFKKEVEKLQKSKYIDFIKDVENWGIEDYRVEGERVLLPQHKVSDRDIIQGDILEKVSDLKELGKFIRNSSTSARSEAIGKLGAGVPRS